jgi:uncharacterized protein YjbJ (UPF0337 family)
MNEHQVKGNLKDAAGKAQEAFGEAVGSKEQEAKGEARQVEGKTEKKVGDVKDGVDKITRKP